MFQLTQNQIRPHDLCYSTTDDVGGIVTFEGRVRVSNNGRKVEKLDYEAFPEMALAEGGKIIEEAKKKFQIYDARCIHRIGSLRLSELAIWIVVYSMHRGPAFLACEYIIDQVKQRVPIWKKEFYVDGQTEWVKCLNCAAKGVAHHEHFHHHE